MDDTEKIQVLIVDDNAEMRENIRKLLQFESDVEVVGAARTGREGIDLAAVTTPDVILMDINMPDMDGIAATEAIRKKVPYAQIVILSVQSDTRYMRRAMLAGARDFITKPPNVDDLTSAIRRAADMAREERKKTVAAQPLKGGPGSIGPFIVPPSPYGKIIVVYSPKGGTGCTTIATNLAMLLHNQDTPTVLVDADLQFGDIPIFLNEQAKNSILDLAPRVDELDNEIVEEVLIEHRLSGVKILAAPPRPEMAEEITADQVMKLLKYLRRLYSYVIVDAETRLSDITLGAMDVADLIIIVIQQDIPSVKNARLFFDLADALGVDRQRVLFTINRYDRRIGITPERVGDSLKLEVGAVIPSEDRVVTTINRGVPMVLEGKTRPFSRGMLTLSEKVRKRLVKLEEMEISAEQEPHGAHR